MTDKIYQPTLAGLRAFVAVAERRQFSGAAVALGVSQSTLSQALSGLEAGLGTRLVERSTRRVFLTPEGAELLPRAQAVVEATDAFTAAAAGTSDPLRAGMRLGLIPTVAPYVLPTVLAGVAEQLPGLTLRVTEDQTERLLAVLREGALDAALIALPAETAGVSAIPIYDEDFVLALPPGHPLAGKRRVPATALADLPLLLLDEGHCLRDQALDVCRMAGASEKSEFQATSLETLRQMVAAHVGVTLLPVLSVKPPVARSEDIHLVPFRDPPPSRRIAMAWRRSSAMAGFLGSVAQVFRDLPPELFEPPAEVEPEARNG